MPHQSCLLSLEAPTRSTLDSVFSPFPIRAPLPSGWQVTRVDFSWDRGLAILVSLLFLNNQSTGIPAAINVRSWFVTNATANWFRWLLAEAAPTSLYRRKIKFSRPWWYFSSCHLSREEACDSVSSHTLTGESRLVRAEDFHDAQLTLRYSQYPSRWRKHGLWSLEV